MNQSAITLPGQSSADVRTQFAALCYKVRKNGKIRVLLITSRTSGRWIIPKGWPIDDKSPVESAAQEAWEEAGARGRPDGDCIGVFSYDKQSGDGGAVPCLVMVFALKVTEMADVFPEAGQRERRWMPRGKAAGKVACRELARIIRDFDPVETS